jgi:hypothetical protein
MEYIINNFFGVILGVIVGIILLLFGLFCLIKPNNFLLKHLRFGEYAGKSIQKQYGKKWAIFWMRIVGATAFLLGIFFILSSLY